jgi:glycosyltransferase involved in cell wall biosynthesis
MTISWIKPIKDALRQMSPPFALKKSATILSVIIPSFNRKDMVKQTIESFLNQKTAYSFEVLVIDDGSIDNTYAELCDCYRFEIQRGILRVFQQNNLGVASARNLGFDKIAPTSEYAIFIDSDDLATEDRIELSVSYLRDHPEKSMLHAKSFFVDPRGEPVRSDRLRDYYENLWKNADVEKTIGQLFSLVKIQCIMQLHAYG